MRRVCLGHSRSGLLVRKDLQCNQLHCGVVALGERIALLGDAGHIAGAMKVNIVGSR